jgi:wyosine [tRNA(Phe)-imidazoG37] synthetase (radical SAM superfamily)
VTVQPKKCTFNCIYCQLGPTKIHVAKAEDVQDIMPSPDAVLDEIELVLKRLDLQSVDVVTFSGAGEPTLNLKIGTIARGVRELVKKMPMVLLTNASLLPDPKVRANLDVFDIITAKLDAGDEDTFRRINHPAKGIAGLDEIIDGIRNLHAEMKGLLALEVMLQRGTRGLSNVEGTPKKMLIERILDINPDIVQIYTPWRPTAVSSVQVVSNEELQEFSRELGEHLSKDRIWTYGIHDARGHSVTWKHHRGIEEEILDMLARRPCRAIDVANSLGLTVSQSIRLLRILMDDGRVTRVAADGVTFFEHIEG